MPQVAAGGGRKRENREEILPLMNTENLKLDPSTALPSYVRNLNRRDCSLGSSLVSVDLSSDEISATGSPQSFALLRMTFPNEATAGRRYQ